MTVEPETVVAWVFYVNLVTCVFGVYVASEKNRGVVAWGLLCAVFGLVALVALAGIPVIDEKDVGERKGPRDRIRIATGAWSDSLGAPPGRDDD